MPSPGGDEVAALVADYEAARDDDRNFIALQGTALSLAIASLTLLAALTNSIYGKDKSEFPDAVLAGAPLVVISLLAFMQAAGAQSILRSFYMRALEREIRARLTYVSDLDNYAHLPPYSFVDLQTTLDSLSKRWNFRRVMVVIVFASLWVVFGGIMVLLMMQVSPPWFFLMLLLYGGTASIIFRDAIRSNLLGRQFFHNQVTELRARLAEPLTPRAPSSRPGRSLGSYLLLPRPDDLIKTVFVVAGGAFAYAWDQSVMTQMAEFVARVLVFELLIYQARYQWNDIRGVTEDSISPMAIERGRLPGGSGSINASLLTMALRFYCVAWFCSITWGQTGTWTPPDAVMALSLLSVFALALPYEEIRSRQRTSGHDRGWSFVFLLVGLGYPLRFAVGWFFVHPEPAPWYFYLFLVGCSALGLLFVSLTWVLEGSSYIIGADSPMPMSRTFTLRHEINSKPHLLALLKHSGLGMTFSPGSTTLDGKNLRLLQWEHWRIISVWTLGAMIAWVCALIAGPPAVGLRAEYSIPWIAMAMFTVIGYLVLKRWKEWFATLLVSLAVALLAILSTLPPQEFHHNGAWVNYVFLVALVELPLLLLIAFSNASYSSTRNGANHLLHLCWTALKRIHLWFVRG